MYKKKSLKREFNLCTSQILESAPNRFLDKGVSVPNYQTYFSAELSIVIFQCNPRFSSFMLHWITTTITRFYAIQPSTWIHTFSHMNKAWLQSGISYNIATWTIYHIKTSSDLSITWGHTLGFLVMKGGKPQIWKSDIWFQRQWFNNIGTCSIGTSYHLLIIY